MTPEQIIEIARRFANEKRRFQPFELNAATVYHTSWEFPEKDLIAFAQSIKDLLIAMEADAGQAAERERIKQIVDDVGWKVKHDAWLDCLDVIMERIEQ